MHFPGATFVARSKLKPSQEPRRISVERLAPKPDRERKYEPLRQSAIPATQRERVA